MTFVFRVSSKRTKKSIRIYADNTPIPKEWREDARKSVLGDARMKKSKEVAERFREAEKASR